MEQLGQPWFPLAQQHGLLIAGLVEHSDTHRKAAALLLVIDAVHSLTPQTLARDATRPVRHLA